MAKALQLYESSIGKKVVVAITGLALFGFVVGHLAGNLKIYQGADKFNAYARFLREVGSPLFGESGVLWLARVVLLAAVAAHMVAVFQLVKMSHRARSVRYQRHDDLSLSYASRTMRWGGAIIVAFVVYHLLHLTFGSVHPDFDHTTPYENVIVGFRVWWVGVAYIVAVLSLGLHLYHGLWSSTQTLALRSARVRRWRRPVALSIAVAIVAGYVSIPVSVWIGVLR